MGQGLRGRQKKRVVESEKQDQDWDGHRDVDAHREMHIYNEIQWDRGEEARDTEEKRNGDIMYPW